MKKQSNFKTILLLSGVILTTLLAIAVVVVSMRLRNVGSEPVAPNAPKSQPKAAVPEACHTSFTIASVPIACEKLIPEWTTWDSTLELFATGVKNSKFDYIISLYKNDVLVQDYTFDNDTNIICTVENPKNCKSGPLNTLTSFPALPATPDFDTPYKLVAKVKQDGSSEDYVTAEACSVKFFKVSPGNADCKEKLIYKNEGTNTAGHYTLTTKISSGTVVDPGTIMVFNLTGEPLTKATAGPVIWTDVLDSKLEWMDGEAGCTYNTTNRTVTCDMGAKNAGESYDVSFRVKVVASATPGEISNTAHVKTNGQNDNTCATAVNVPTPPADAGFEIEKFKDTNGNGTRDNSEAGLTWNFEWDLNGDNNWRAYATSADNNGKGGRIGGLHDGDVIRVKEKDVDGWVATTLTTQTTTIKVGQTQVVRFGNKPKTVVSCNSSCTTTSDCMNGLVCSGGFCRNSSCTGETDCTCPVVVTATATPTPTPTLPKSGSVAGTATVFGLGAIVTVLGIIGFLAL